MGLRPPLALLRDRRHERRRSLTPIKLQVWRAEDEDIPPRAALHRGALLLVAGLTISSAARAQGETVVVEAADGNVVEPATITLTSSAKRWFGETWIAPNIVGYYCHRRAQLQSNKDARYVPYTAGARSQVQTGDNIEETIPALGNGDGAEPVRGGVRR